MGAINFPSGAIAGLRPSRPIKSSGEADGHGGLADAALSADNCKLVLDGGGSFGDSLLLLRHLFHPLGRFALLFG